VIAQTVLETILRVRVIAYTSDAGHVSYMRAEFTCFEPEVESVIERDLARRAELREAAEKRVDFRTNLSMLGAKQAALANFGCAV